MGNPRGCPERADTQVRPYIMRAGRPRSQAPIETSEVSNKKTSEVSSKETSEVSNKETSEVSKTSEVFQQKTSEVFIFGATMSTDL